MPVPAADAQGIFRLDLLAAELVPVNEDELKVGHIYNHRDSTTGRREWSYWTVEKRFWRPFGPGTTQAARLIDPNANGAKAVARLRAIDPQLAELVSRTDTSIYLTLEPEGRWRLKHISSLPMIFDEATGFRWEYHGVRYIPVVHVAGYEWQYSDGQYVAR